MSKPNDTIDRTVEWVDRNESETETLEFSTTSFTTNANGCCGGIFRSLVHQFDPYIQLTLIPTKESQTTKCIRGVRQNAKWTKAEDNYKEFIIPTHYIGRPQSPIKMLIEIWDASINVRDEFIGSRVIDLMPATNEKYKKRELKIKFHDDIQCIGLLTVNVSYTETLNPVQQRIVITESIRRAQKMSFSSLSRDNILTFGLFKFEILSFEGTQPIKSGIMRSKAYLWMICVLIVWISFGCLIFHFLESDWSFVNLLYFVTVTTSSVGYGDLTPTNSASKGFTAFYALISHLTIFATITMLTGWIITDDVNRREKIKYSMKRREALFEELDHEIRGYHSMEKEESSALQRFRDFIDIYKELIVLLLSFVLWIIVWCLYFVYAEDGTWSEMIYFAILTATTIGYGTHKVESDSGKVFVSFSVIIGVGLLTNIGIAITVWFNRKRYQRTTKKILEERLSLSHFSDFFKGFDVFHNDGVIDQAQFVEMELVKMGIVPKSLLDELNQKFVDYAGPNNKVITINSPLGQRQRQSQFADDKKFWQVHNNDLKECKIVCTQHVH